MTPLRCLLVDDEPLALRLLASFVARVPVLALVGTCRNAQEALETLAREPVDVLFLDIQMPGLTGVELVRLVRPQALVVFTTAYETFAVEGFALDALDYLVKPIAFDRFLQAVQRAQARRAAPAAGVSTSAGDFLFVKVDAHTQRVPLHGIRYLEALRDYVRLHVGAPRPLLTLNSLRAFEERLPAADFVRVHKSFIVALPHITSFHKGRLYLGEAVIPVGEAYAKAFQAAIAGRQML